MTAASKHSRSKAKSKKTRMQPGLETEMILGRKQLTLNRYSSCLSCFAASLVHCLLSLMTALACIAVTCMHVASHSHCGAVILSSLTLPHVQSAARQRRIGGEWGWGWTNGIVASSLLFVFSVWKGVKHGTGSSLCLSSLVSPAVFVSLSLAFLFLGVEICDEFELDWFANQSQRYHVNADR